jgi:transposase-like protein
MQRSKYTAEFKAEAVKQVVDNGRTVIDVASRLGLVRGVMVRSGTGVLSFLSTRAVC